MSGQRGRIDQPLERKELLFEVAAHRGGVVVGFGEVERIADQRDGAEVVRATLLAAQSSAST